MASWLIPFLPCCVNIDINLDEPFTPTFAPAQCELGISIWSSSFSVLVCFLLCTSSTIDPSILSPVLQHAPISKKTRASPIDLCQVPITWGEKRIFLGTQMVGNKKGFSWGWNGKMGWIQWQSYFDAWKWVTNKTDRKTWTKRAKLTIIYSQLYPIG